MLQIRLSKAAPGEAGAGAATRPPAAAETVTVACPDHLVIADLPVAKSLGAVTSSAAPAVRSIGRRSRRLAGERVHFCVRCDFPIAVYGRLIPCEHAFCLTCARSDSSCYICDDRFQKIQTIKMMEGIFICAAPHCLKSFLKKSEFETHVHETHVDLLQNNAEKGGNEADASYNVQPSSTDPQKQSSQQPEISTARAPRPDYSPNLGSQSQDRDEKSRRYPQNDQAPGKPPLQQKMSTFHGHLANQQSDQQLDGNPTQGFEKPPNWFNQAQSFENTGSFQYPPAQPGITPDALLQGYPPLQALQPPINQLSLNANQTIPTTPFPYPAFPTEALQLTMTQSGSDHGSVFGFPPALPAGATGFPEGFPRPWAMGFMGMPLNQIPMGQGVPEGFVNRTDSSADQNDGKAMLVSMPLQMPLPMPLPPPPPLPPLLSQQLNRGSFPSPSVGNQDGQTY